MVGQDSRMAMRVAAGARLVSVLKSVADGLPHPGWRGWLMAGACWVERKAGGGCFGRGCTVGRNCCGVERGAVGVGIGEPERGSGCRVRVGVVERGGVLERLVRGVPPIIFGLQPSTSRPPPVSLRTTKKRKMIDAVCFFLFRFLLQFRTRFAVHFRFSTFP